MHLAAVRASRTMGPPHPSRRPLRGLLRMRRGECGACCACFIQANSGILAAHCARVFLRFPPPKQGAGGVDPRKMRGGRRADRRNQSVCARGRTLLAQTAQACLRDRAAPLGAPSRRFLTLVPRFRSGRRGGPISFPLIRAASAALRPRARPAFEGSRSSCRRAGGQGLPGAWRAVHARGRRPEPHEPAQPVHGPSWDRARQA